MKLPIFSSMVLACTLALAGCSQTMLDILAETADAMTTDLATPQLLQNSMGPKISIYGGPRNHVYLGCLSCSQYSSESVLNTYGEYGSVYSQTSIINASSLYGSPYATTSACSLYAASPPAVIDEHGRFYGYLTVNPHKTGAINYPDVVTWLQGVCEGR